MSDQPLFPPDAGDGEFPSARGLLDCLRMLTDEALALRLTGTAKALRAAIAVCAAESEPDLLSIGAPTDAVLH